MKRLFLIALFALQLYPVAAFYQSRDSNYNVGILSTGTPFSITETASASNAAGTSPFTFTSQSIGTADPTRIVVVVIAHGPNNTAISAVTIGGSSATQATGAATNATSTGATLDVWYLAVAAGTTATIVVTSASETRMAITVFSVVGTGAAFSAANQAATAGAGTSLSAAVTVPSGGGAIVAVSSHSASSTFTPANWSADIANLVVGSSTTSFGHDTSHSGSTTYSATFGSVVGSSLTMVAFSP